MAISIKRHKENPATTYESYVNNKMKMLIRAISGRKSIYLDTKYWIILCDVSLGKISNPESIELLSILRHGVCNNTIFCPISESNFLEIMKQDDMRSRLETAKLIDELSLGVTLLSIEDLISMEIRNFILCTLKSNPILPAENLVWTKLACVIGRVTQPPMPGSKTTQRAMQKAYFERLWNLSATGMMNELGNKFPPPSWGSLAGTLNLSKDAHALEIKSFADAYAAEIRGVVELFSQHAIDVVRDIANYNNESDLRSDEQSKEILSKILVKAFEKDDVRRALPTMHIHASLHAIHRWDKKRRFEANDFYDFNHAASALGYCDVFLTENSLKSMVGVGPVFLDRLLNCKVSAKLDDAIAVVRQFVR